MLKFAEAQEKVNHIVGKFVDMLYGNYPIDRYRILQYTMALLCKAKGECLTLSKVDNEYENYGIPLLTIDTFINAQFIQLDPTLFIKRNIKIIRDKSPI